MPDEDKVPSEEQDGDDRTPPPIMPGDETFPSEDQESVERILPNREIPYCEFFMVEEAGEILLFNKTNYNV